MNTKLKKSLAATGIAVGLVLSASWGVAAPASAITNPADNPRKIVVKGDDGQTYVDGQDTLPGYDDEACTYIPGAWFDFKNNRVNYADGQSIPWTEWDRASGYQEWLKSSKGSDSGTKTGSSSGSSTKTPSKSTGTKTTESGDSSKKGSSGSTSGDKAATTNTSQASSQDPGAESGSSTTKKDKKAATAASTEGTDPVTTTEVVSEATAEPAATNTEAAAAQKDGSGNPGPLVGIAVLGGLAAAGGLAWAGVAIFRRRASEGS